MDYRNAFLVMIACMILLVTSCTYAAYTHEKPSDDSIMKTKAVTVTDGLVTIQDGSDDLAFYNDSIKEGDWVYVRILNGRVTHVSTESFDDLMTQCWK